MKNINRWLSGLLCVPFLASASLGVISLPTANAQAESETVDYLDTFDYLGFNKPAPVVPEEPEEPEVPVDPEEPEEETLFTDGTWTLGDAYRTDSGTPTFEDGVIKLKSREAVTFHWTKLVAHDAAKVYTYEFDLKITDAGTGADWSAADCTRALFFSLGGWYNQIELPNKSNKVRAGDTYADFDANAYVNKDLHVKFVLEGTKATTTIYNADGEVIITGSRTNNNYASTTDKSVPEIAFRCEDGAFEMDNFTFTDGTYSYKEEFSYGAIEEEKTLFTDGTWTNGDTQRTGATLPTVANGKFKAVNQQGVSFNWQNLVTYDSAKTYTFEFDFKVTDAGNGAQWETASNTRAIFAGFGGYYNQIEIPMSDGKVRAGDTKVEMDQSAYLNTELHAKLELTGKTATTTIYNADGEALITGFRTSDAYASTTDKYMPTLGIRCEDGAFEMDNFTFTDGTYSYTEDFSYGVTEETPEEVPEETPEETPEEVETLFTDGKWTIGDTQRTGAAPTVANGKMSAINQQGVSFNWKNLVTYDSAKTYTFEFDFKITDLGTGAQWITASNTRALFVGFGGYYNQLELPTDANKVRAGDTYVPLDTDNVKIYLGTALHAKLELTGKTATTTIYNANGDVLVTGSRTSDNYASTADKYMPTLGIRCEDGAFELDNFTFTDGTYSYTQEFSYASAETEEPEEPKDEEVYAPLEPGDYMTETGVWKLGDLLRTDAGEPTLENGVLKLKTYESVSFNWYKLTRHEASKIYTFEFDFKITDMGNGAEWPTNTADCTRALFFSFGGWYNQIELPTKDGKVRAGDTRDVMDESKYLNKNLHVKFVLDGGTATTTIYDADGNVLITGSRTNASYGSGLDQYVPEIAFRCEDGAVEIDNLHFYSKSFAKADSSPLAITAGKYAIYQSTVTYDGEQKISLRLNNTEFFSISAETSIVIAGSRVTGTYGAGEYGVKATVNPEQKLVMVEITLPNGGIIRRGSYNLLPLATAFSIDTFAFSKDSVKNVSVSYADVSMNTYELVETEPTYEGFDANVYNLITSFDDAATTRNFAFTALSDFVGYSSMAVKYRVKGTEEWSVVDAILELETANNREDYYKADIVGLQPGTEYEYKIGIKGSTDETNEWSKTYTFKTATGNEDEFTFLAVGDTQGITWNGRSGGDKGFMFAQTAYREAFAEYSNAAFMMHTGDLVEDGGNVNQWNMFFKSFGEYGASVPFFATTGNHDIVNLNDAYQNWYYDLHLNAPNNGGSKVFDKGYAAQVTDGWMQSLIRHADETVYSFNYGDAHFAVLASGRYHPQDQYILEAQRAWLDADLKANACAKWKIVLVHEPVYHRVGGAESRPWLYDVIESNGVDLVIQGHSHLVTRSYPMMNGQIVSKQNLDVIKQGVGTVYTTVGATAYNHDGLGNPNMEEMALIATPDAEQPTYTSVTVNGDKIVMTVKQINGLIIDRFEITADENKADHAGTISTQGQVDATCGADGYTGDQVCSQCGKVVTAGEAIPATGEHVYSKEVVDEKYLAEEATCTDAAKYYKSCECGAIGTETFEVGEGLGHSFDDEYTCHDRTCNVCGEPVAATTEHNWGEGEVTKQPTETEKGEKTYTCDCGATKTEEIPTLTPSEPGEPEPGDPSDPGENKPATGCGAVAFSGTAIAALVLSAGAILFVRKKD